MRKMPYSCVVGNPAKFLYYVCECSEKMKFDKNYYFKCSKCGKEYILENNIVRRK